MQSGLSILVLICVLLLAAPGAASQPASARSAHAASRADADPVDVNRATVAELLKVPGITKVWAERIVRFRPYRTRQDLVEQGVLPGGVYSKIKDHVVAHRIRP